MEKWQKKVNRLALNKEHVRALLADIKHEIKMLRKDMKLNLLDTSEFKFYERFKGLNGVKNVIEAYTYHLYLECYLNNSFKECKDYAIKEIEECYNHGFIKDEYPGAFLLYKDDLKEENQNNKMNSGHMFISIGTFWGG